MGLEIRWFFAGEVPDHTLSWFRGDANWESAVAVEERTDIYLNVSNEDFGIKLRETTLPGQRRRAREDRRFDKLEIKWRREHQVFDARKHQIAGKAEDWVKWDWKDIDGKSQEMILKTIQHGPQAVWVEIAKVRQQRKYEFKGESLLPVPLDKMVSRGGFAELTTLTIRNETWWTLGFDIFGGFDEALEAFRRAAESLFNGYREPGLRLENSFGFPRWLLTRAAVGQDRLNG